MPQVECKIESIEPLTEVVSKIVLSPVSRQDFKPGQYLKVVMAEGDKRPFSIANAPREDGSLELHIGVGPGADYAAQVLDRLQTSDNVAVEVGHGNAYVRDSIPRPTILVAGGTGFSYARSVLERLLTCNDHEPIFLYWGTRSKDDMYAFDELQAWQKQHKHFQFIPVFEAPPQGWTGKTGWVHKAVLDDFVSLEPYHVYIAGRFEMAGVAREDFHNKGLLLEHLYGDAYEFI